MDYVVTGKIRVSQTHRVFGLFPMLSLRYHGYTSMCWTIKQNVRHPSILFSDTDSLVYRGVK